VTNIIFLFGTIAGLIVIAVLIASLALAGQPSEPGSEWLGYLVMILALSLIFFAVKRYRDRELGGVIRFAPALLMGLAIAAVAGVIYVLMWEVYLAATNYAFIDTYAAAVVEAERAKGTAGDIAKVMADVEAAKTLYANPITRMAITFIEIFPVGLIIALISAAILRNPKVLPAQA
jgi:hypothetical protein